MKQNILTFLSVVIAAATMSVYPAASDDALQKRVTRFLAAYNSGDPDQIREAVEQHFATGDSEGTVAYWFNLYREYGPLEIVTLEQRSFGKEVVPEFWTRGRRTRTWVGLVFWIQQDEPHLIESYGVDRGVRPCDRPVQQPRVTQNNLQEYLEAYFESLTEGEHFSGVVLLAHEGRPLFHRAYGWADRERQIKNQLDTPFRLASVTKMFTAVAIAQVVQQGKLSFDDPIGGYLPELPESVGENVTVRHLLTHTSGIELDEIPEYLAQLPTVEKVGDLLRLQLRFLPRLPNMENYQPLSHFDYTNEGYDLLGAILESVSGLAWEAYLHRFIFEPLQMQASGAVVPPGNEKLARAYTPRGDRPRDLQLTLRRRDPARDVPRPSGSAYSTAADLLRFINALEEGTLLSSDLVAKMTKARVARGKICDSEQHYGYGFFVSELDGLRRVGHGGDEEGVDTVVWWFPETGYMLVVLANRDRAASPAAQHLQEVVLALAR